MNKLLSISTLAIASSLILTGCGSKQEPTAKQEDNSMPIIEAENIETKTTSKNTKTDTFEVKEQLVKCFDNITIATENKEATNEQKIQNLKVELGALNKINISSVDDKNLKDAFDLLKDGVSKEITFLEGTIEYHKGNKPDEYKEELIGIKYEATDLLLAAQIILK